MRGSVYYQTALLTQAIFRSGAKKLDRVDRTHDDYKAVASYGSMQTYRKVWNNLGLFIKEVYGINDLERLTQEHVSEYMYSKIAEKISHQHLQKISSAIAKLELALSRVSIQFQKNRIYDFSKRLDIVKEAIKNELTSNNYRNRAYDNAQQVISLLQTPAFKIAANIQFYGGARAEGVSVIREEQLKGEQLDEITQTTTGVIQTKEKGGKIGLVRMDVQTYAYLKSIIEIDGIFKIDYRRYSAAIQSACRILGVKSEGSHGLRWNFAQRRVIEYQAYGYSYEDALQMV